MERLFSELFHQPVAFIVALVVTIGIGVLIDMRLNTLLAEFRRKSPPGVPPETWGELLEWPETYGGNVHWLGVIERIFFLAFVALWTWPPILGWLFFKLGCYWGLWHNIMRVRDPGPEMNAMDVMVAQSRRANVLAMMCLFNTLGNLLAALLGAFIAMVALWWLSSAR
jgi:hypothetical protein